jgi:2',3'-cyclic-nucleotide 2'-phosphodiesterase (5'-nucleotidase family)
MRTKTLLLTAALAAAGVASSMAQGTVFSVNAVGYVNTTLKKGFNLIANPLDAGADNTIGTLFKSLPFGTQVYRFNGTGFDIATYDDIEGKYTSATPAMLTAQIKPGEGLFVKNNTAVDQTVTFVGEVPQGALSNPFPKGLSIRSSQVPQDGKLTTDLAFPAKPGDQVSKFDSTTQKFVGPYTFDDLVGANGSWTLSGAANEPVLTVGESVFVRAANAGTWSRTFNVN